MALPALLFLVFGCSDNEPEQRYSYLRGAAQFQVDTARSDMGCDDPGPNFSDAGFDPEATCRSVRKYLLTWEMPDDTVGFNGYRVYLDTTPDNQTWASAKGDARKAAVIVPWSGKKADTLIFFFLDRDNPPPGIRYSPGQDTLHAGKRRVFALDSSERLEEVQERFIFALATHFKEGTQGQPQYVQIITGDKLRPMPFQPAIRIGARDLGIDWSRPGDMISDFNRDMDTGIIAGYYLTLKLFGGSEKGRTADFNPEVEFRKGDVKVDGPLRDTAISTRDGFVTGRRYFLPDGGRAGRGTATLKDSLSVLITGLVPQDSLELELYAVDSAGNDNSQSMTNNVTVILTDTTQPTKPELTLADSLTSRNEFVLSWTASRDLVASGGEGPPRPADRPNDSIAEYRLTRALKRAAGSPEDASGRRDTVIKVTDGNRGDSVFADTVRYLPPGKTYVITVTAVDKSGYASETDSAEVTTDSIRFAGADSGHTCPPGLIPIPAARFDFGDASSAGEPDEKTKDGKSRPVSMGSFCIEPYEHRDSLGNFVTRVTWEEASAICRDLAPGDGSDLCSEAEWERACEGFDVEAPHLHGIQSETNPGILQSSCNQATGDSAMAMSFKDREPVCLTNEGVFDMAGNLSEWVRDYYDAKGIADLEDSALEHGFSFQPSGSGDTLTLHSIRGGNFLKPASLPLSKVQSLARCSNRDFPAPIRPKVRKDCVDTAQALVAVVYGDGLENVHCFPVPGEVAGKTIEELRIDAKDSSKIHYFIAGEGTPTAVKFAVDSAFLGKKPREALLTPLSLAEVIFERVADPANGWVKDTLDAREMQHATESDLKRILDRESPSRAWRPRQVDGKPAIRKIYAYALSWTKVAKPNMASRSIGFRCCSRSRPPAPADSSVTVSSP